MSQLNTFTRHTDNTNETLLAKHLNELQAAIEPLQAIVSKTAAYTATATDDVILGDASGGAFTVTLPTAVGIPGKRYTIKRTSSSNNVTVDGDGSETIDGATTKALATQYAAIVVVSDGTGWHIVSSMGTVS